MVIGLDFGNYNSAGFVIQGMNDQTRLDGNPIRLVPPEYPYGIPSVYFYTNRHGTGETFVGYRAVSMQALPLENRLRYLKRKLNETVKIDDRYIEINDAITEVIQFCVREANVQLKNNFGKTTHQIALAYPVSYSATDREQLKRLAESATLEDGTRVQVVGTIAEPAAAALDYLAVQHSTNQPTNILVYDLGGGTFDLSLVKATPRGETIKGFDGKCYYRIIGQAGDPDVGGVNFDEALFELLKKKINIALNGDSLTKNEEDNLRAICEETKVELSHYDLSYPVVNHKSETLDISVTREEFEAATEQLLMRTIDLTKQMIENPSYAHYRPAYIVLTGGASQMPMVEAALKKHLPDYADRIRMHNPTMAIACGAARYGAVEYDFEPGDLPPPPPTVVQSLDFDIGVRLKRSGTTEKYIDTYLTKGTPYPCKSPWHKSYTASDKLRVSLLVVFQSLVDNPNVNKLEDYSEIMDVYVDHGRELPKGVETKSRIVVTKDGSIKIEAYSKKNAAVHYTQTYYFKPKSSR